MSPLSNDSSNRRIDVFNILLIRLLRFSRVIFCLTLLAADLILGKVLNLLPVLYNIKILSSVPLKSKPLNFFYYLLALVDISDRKE